MSGAVTVTAFDAEVIAFLMGQGPLEGVWFHDRHPTRKGAFWWRSVLRERSETRHAAEAASKQQIAELETLVADAYYVLTYLQGLAGLAGDDVTSAACKEVRDQIDAARAKATEQGEGEVDP